ncbi:MAG: D-alanine--D-alanine ligase [Micavibrio sp.]|nr:D-alanine--D-alanine ligase [Micavibrio sp.]|tara:strand:- start:1250 stop:2344 length:1095 start_codon:yes stop_codon:yes gene_type:complete
MLQIVEKQPPYQGLPALDKTVPPLSFFELWPRFLFYPPVLLYAFWLTIKFDGLNTLTASNPYFPAGGFVGDSKKAIHELFPKALQQYLPKTVFIKNEQALDSYFQIVELTYPVVCKPDKGCRGAGVQKIHSDKELKNYAQQFPFGKDTLLIQEHIDFEAEAGVFYIRHPDQERGHIFSLTLKYFPYVYGDGVSTLETLIKLSPRASKLQKIYLKRHAHKLHTVLAQGEAYRLSFAGAHSKGTIFKNGDKHITPAMEEFFDRLSKQIPEFYFGRFDVRFKDMSSLETGENLKIIELNGAGAEATHIWDSSTKLKDAYKTLFEQFHHAYEIGHKNKQRGFKPTPLKEALLMVRQSEALTAFYPETH